VALLRHGVDVTLSETEMNAIGRVLVVWCFKRCRLIL